MENHRDIETLEKKASKYIYKKIKLLVPLAKMRFESSDRSHSQYIYAHTMHRGVGIKISDHLKEMNPRYIKFVTRRRENREFYLFTVPGYTGFKEFFRLDQIDDLIEEVVAYLNVSSDKQEQQNGA